jgi:hypothetical protein
VEHLKKRDRKRAPDLKNFRGSQGGCYSEKNAIEQISWYAEIQTSTQKQVLA